MIAEHEFNPSSYVARIIGSTRTNLYGPFLGALEAFMGTDHRGGDDRPLDLLDRVGTVNAVDDWIARLPADSSLPGFGHPIHLEEDPRVPLLAPICAELAEACGRSDMEILAGVIQRRLWETRRIAPNVDWPLARLFSYLGFSRDLFKPLFVNARLIGWSAHALEQCESSVVIRPRARYRGAEDIPFEPMRRRIY
jgi:citrate synthase